MLNLLGHHVTCEALKCYYGVEISTLWKVYQKYIVSFEMWSWRRMSWNYRVKIGVLHIVKEGRNFFLGTAQEGRL